MLVVVVTEMETVLAVVTEAEVLKFNIFLVFLSLKFIFNNKKYITQLQ